MFADIVIVGGGLGGFVAAREALKKGVSVILVDKARAGSSGPTVFAAGDMLCWLPEEDDLERWIDYYLQVGEGLNFPDRLRHLFETNYQLIKHYDEEGFQIKKTNDGSYLRRGGRGKVTKNVLIPMYEFMKELRRRLAKQGAEFLDRVQVINLNKEDDLFTLQGISIRDERVISLQARSVILAAGGCSFKGPFFGQDVVSGEGLNLAYKTGARLGYLEYGNHFNVSLKEFDTYGQSKFMAHGGRYINRLGEAFLEDKKEGNKVSGYIAVRRMMEEVQAGRGPIYLDLREFKERELVKELMPHLQAMLESSDTDFFDTPNEVIPAFTGTSNAAGAGVLIDERSRTDVPGLYAVGDNASKGLIIGACVGLSGVSLAWANVTGYEAGRDAADYVKGDFSGPGEQADLSESSKRSKEITGNIESLFDKANIQSEAEGARKGPRQIYQELAGIMGNGYINIIRDGKRLDGAIKKINILEEELNALTGLSDFHELMLSHETSSALRTGKFILNAARERRESRGAHYREDYPDKKEEFAGKVSVLQKAETGLQIDFIEKSRLF